MSIHRLSKVFLLRQVSPSLLVRLTFSPSSTSPVLRLRLGLRLAPAPNPSFSLRLAMIAFSLLSILLMPGMATWAWCTGAAWTCVCRAGLAGRWVASCGGKSGSESVDEVDLVEAFNSSAGWWRWRAVLRMLIGPLDLDAVLAFPFAGVVGRSNGAGGTCFSMIRSRADFGSANIPSRSLALSASWADCPAVVIALWRVGRSETCRPVSVLERIMSLDSS